jgi:Universal stress protein UspA and related nucleotide-binding proteins
MSETNPASPGGESSSGGVALVVGVAPDLPEVVVTEAARFARELGARLVCAYAEPSRYPVEVLPSGIVTSMPIDPEVPDVREETFDPELGKRIRALAGGVEVELHALAGDPPTQLARLADEVDARAIVVGTRRPGFRSGVEEFFAGSVAVGLAHHQHRPVIVVPVAPAPGKPWEPQR